MAKGEGGGGHFDERRRAKKAATGYADSPEVLSAISKPKVTKKPPVVVVKKKKLVAPSRVQTDSDSGDVPEPTRTVVTNYNTEKRRVPIPREKPASGINYGSERQGSRGDFMGAPPPSGIGFSREYPTANSAAKSSKYPRTVSDWARRLAVGQLGKSSAAAARPPRSPPSEMEPPQVAAEARSGYRMGIPTDPAYAAVRKEGRIRSKLGTVIAKRKRIEGMGL